MNSWGLGIAVISLAFASVVKGAPADKVDLEDRAIRVSQRLSQRIEVSATSLNKKELRGIMEHLKGIRQILNGQGGQSPGRGERRGPAPRLVSVRGDIENKAFSFEVAGLAELFEQCADFHDVNRLGNVDEINVSVDFGTPVALYNSGSYWKSSSMVCSKIVEVAKSKGLTEIGSDYQYVVVGDIENKAFAFMGHNKNEINAQCEAFHASKRLGNVDEINVDVNFKGNKKLYYSSSYWKSSFEVCQQIMGQL